jgi:short-subunit dehydrogenase
MKSKPAALVTGASSGIGAALCRLLAREGYELVITARRADRLEALKSELEPATRVHTIPLDLGLPESPAQLFGATRQLGLTVELLVNNAGYALPGRYLQSSWEEQARLIQVLATAPAHLVHQYLPGMIARGRGYVLNVASIGAFVPASPQMTLYAALKHFLLVMNRSLAEEYSGKGVQFTALCPGPTATEWASMAQADSVFAELPRWAILSAQRVAALGYQALMSGRDTVVTGAASRIATALLPFVPDALALKWLAKNAPSTPDA